MTQWLGGVAAEAQPSRSTTQGWRGLFALQDLIPLAYFGVIRLLVWRAAPSAARDLCAVRVDACLVAITAACLFARGLTVTPRARAVLYRICLAAVVVESYLMLRELLPLVRQDVVDELLLRADLALLGFEPAFWLERFNVTAVVEYFSFFYFSYFFIIAGYMVAMLWLVRPGRHTSEYAIGSFLVMCLGQLGYLAVPGTGPIRHFADQFHGPVNGGVFWHCIWSTVEAGGAMKDIFPSLHTALPTYYAIFAWRQALGDRRWRWVAWLNSWFALNIIASTMVLRWHYLVDVLAGLALAWTVGNLAPRLAAWEERRRIALGHPQVWLF